MSDRRVIALTLGINGLYIASLFGIVGFRFLTGLTPVPAGNGPLIMGSAVFAPVTCIGLGNFLRLRRNA
jgi:hypothetical protein